MKINKVLKIKNLSRPWFLICDFLVEF